MYTNVVHFIHMYACFLLSTAAESDRTVTREAGAGAWGHMTRASLSVPAADRSPGYGGVLVHGSNTIRGPEPAQVAVLTSAVSAGAVGHGRSSSASAPPREKESRLREEDQVPPPKQVKKAPVWGQDQGEV